MLRGKTTLATDERVDLGMRARNERLGEAITRRSFLGASSAGITWLALSGSLGREQTARTRAAAAPRGPGAARARDEVALYVGWKGATGVATWRLLAGPGPEGVEPVGSVPRKGIETAVTLRTDQPCVAAKAKDGSGRVLGTSQAAKPLEQASSVLADQTIP